VCHPNARPIRLGEAIARAFAAQGAAGLVLCGRNEEKGRAVCASLQGAHPNCRAIYVKADLASTQDTMAIVAKADEAFGRVDVLVNAVSRARGPVVYTATEHHPPPPALPYESEA
jgi:NAD(P)-dependent dehydrogenase (short-subunit alcohol dehydrogenase family)